MDEQKYKVTLWRENRQVVFEVETLFEPLFHYEGTVLQVVEVNGNAWTAMLMPGDTVKCEAVE